MPINIPDRLPAKDILQNENIFVIGRRKASHQDIRPLNIAIVNLMPLKIDTETQLMRLLSNTPLQVEIDLLMTGTYKPKNTAESHLKNFYNTFSNVKNKKYDGMIVTGAPVEQEAFENVLYWKEITEIFEWAKTNVTSTFYICWAAQAALYYYYGIEKCLLPKKVFGVFEHKLLNNKPPIVRGFDDVFTAPHSRHTTVKKEDILKVKDLQLLAESPEAGVYLATAVNRRRIFVTGHSEYDALTLKAEYLRDKNKGLEIEKPYNYFPDNNEHNFPKVSWRSHANLLFSNWLNYYVYQETPYDIHEIK